MFEALRNPQALDGNAGCRYGATAAVAGPGLRGDRLISGEEPLFVSSRWDRVPEGEHLGD